MKNLILIVVLFALFTLGSSFVMATLATNEPLGNRTFITEVYKKIPKKKVGLVWEASAGMAIFQTGFVMLLLDRRSRVPRVPS